MKQTRKDILLNEKDSLEDMLLCEKKLLDFYAFALAEGSTPNLRKEIAELYLESAEGQFDLFLQMQARGYYELKTADEEELKKAKEKFKKIKFND